MATKRTGGAVAVVFALGVRCVWAAGPTLTKTAIPAIAGQGDTVQFRIGWSNVDTDTEFAVSVTEAVPPSMVFVPEPASSMICGNSSPSSIAVAYSTLVTGSPPPISFWTTLLPAGSPPAGATWLRWSVTTLAIGTAGCGSYRMTVNDGLPNDVLSGRGASATYFEGGVDASPGYSATAYLTIANPGVCLFKTGSPPYISATAGGTVTFAICFSNCGSGSAFNLTISDHLPNNSTYLTAGYSAWAIDMSTGMNQAIVETYGGSPAGPWNPGPPNGQLTPLYIHWVVPNQGIGKSGCIFYAVNFD